MKTLNHNYTSICWYCGAIFKSNRSSAKHCSSSHKSLFGIYGSRISPYVVIEDGKYYNAGAPLTEAYEYSGTLVEYRQGWSFAFLEESLVDWFGYKGPLPKDDALLIVAGYALKSFFLKGEPLERRYLIKPIVELIREEKASGIFIHTGDVDQSLHHRQLAGI